MKCPECGKEMRNGYLFCSKDGAFSFANEVPGVFTDAKKADGLLKLPKLNRVTELISVLQFVRIAKL